MKKLIAIAVVFILAVGVAFAADVSAEVIGITNLLTGDTQDGSKVQAGWARDWDGSLQGRIRVTASGQNDEGNFGGWFRFQSNINGGPGLHGLAWWKPHDIFKVTLGTNPDGQHDFSGTVNRWGYYKVGSDVGVPKEAWMFNQSFYKGFGEVGAVLSLTPLEPLQINLMIPFENNGEAKDVYRQLTGQVSYNISGIGMVALTYRGSLNKHASFDYGPQWSGTNSKLFAYFGLSAIDNLNIDLGVGYTLPADILGDDEKKVSTITEPVAIGLGIKFTTGPLGIQTRIQGIMGGKIEPVKGSVTKSDMVITADLMPYFDVTDTVTAYLSTGLQLRSYEADGVESTVGWHIEPYVTVKASWWAPNFYAGIRFEGDGTGDKITKWSIPVGICFAY